MKMFPPNVPILLDCRPAEKITAFLFGKGGNDDPKVLLANKNKSFIGSYVLGMGFTFDDTNPEATPIAEMHRLIEKDSRNAERIFPYIGGEEVNSSPTHAHHRYVINLGEMTETEARKWPDLMAIVEEKVKGTRGKHSTAPWWQFERLRGELFKATAECERVLVAARHQQYWSLAFMSSNVVFSEGLVIIADQHYSTFSILKSRIHEIWVRFFGSSLEDRLRYTPSDCFETFPFPEFTSPPSPLSMHGEGEPESPLPPPSPPCGEGGRGGEVEAIGKAYYDYRADLMIRNNQGLTDTYNRFHDPNETHPDILKLRELHHQMDRAVLAAYGWQDIDTPCGFALDYLDTDPDDLPALAAERIATGDLFFPTADEAAAFGALISTGKRKLPWRYKWPEATHDEVLARLLDLNQQRHLEEIRGHKAAEGDKAKGKIQKAKRKSTTQTPSDPTTPTIPGLEL